MAEHTRIFRLKWENGVSVEMESKLDDGSFISIVSMDENGHIGSLWPSFETICTTFFGEKLSEVGSEMKG
jgi:6-phosphogluconolactonase/glucosamine-6-phosphate isomerase/deaminase